MAAPERFAESQIPLAPRAPSIHGPSRKRPWPPAGRLGSTCRRNVGPNLPLVTSGPEGFHLRALPEPYVNLSIHTAPIVRRLPWHSEHTGARLLQAPGGRSCVPRMASAQFRVAMTPTWEESHEIAS